MKKAKLKEERSDAKPAAAGLPQLAEGNFRTTSVNSYPLPPQSNLTQPEWPRRKIEHVQCT